VSTEATGQTIARGAWYAWKPAPRACSACPWRVENDGKTDSPKAWAYTPETRATLWDGLRPGHGMSDGLRMGCHPTGREDEDGRLVTAAPNGKILACAGGDALQQRAVLRAWVSRDLGALKSWYAVRAIVEYMFGLRRPLLLTWQSPISTTRNGSWIEGGRPITFERLVAAAHPAVFDAGIASEQVPPPTAEEFAIWRRHR